VFYRSDLGRGLQVTDVNRDGFPDLITGPSVGGAGVFWLGNGDSTFQPAASYMAGSESRPTGFVVADFEGNGFPDLAFLSQDFGTDHGQVVILKNQADWPAPSPLRPVHPQVPAVGAAGPMVTAGGLALTNVQFPVQWGEQDGSCRISRPGTDYLEHQAAPPKHVRLQLQSRAIDNVFTRARNAWDSLVSAPL